MAATRNGAKIPSTPSTSSVKSGGNSKAIGGNTMRGRLTGCRSSTARCSSCFSYRLVLTWMIAPHVVRGRMDNPRCVFRTLVCVSHVIYPDVHEIAVVSGLAAAYRLGAACVPSNAYHQQPRLLVYSYPFVEDEGCKRLFCHCLSVSHASRLVRHLGLYEKAVLIHWLLACRGRACLHDGKAVGSSRGISVFRCRGGSSSARRGCM